MLETMWQSSTRPSDSATRPRTGFDPIPGSFRTPVCSRETLLRLAKFVLVSSLNQPLLCFHSLALTAHRDTTLPASNLHSRRQQQAVHIRHRSSCSLRCGSAVDLSPCDEPPTRNFTENKPLALGRAESIS